MMWEHVHGAVASVPTFIAFLINEFSLFVDFPQPPVTLREKRDYVKGELLETEGNYIEALNMLKKKFMKPVTSLLKDEDRKIVFFGIKVSFCYRIIFMSVPIC